MASPAIDVAIEISLNDGESDYGSDFSPEEEQIVTQLLSGQKSRDDNPIVNDAEHDDSQRVLHLPRIVGRAQRSILFQRAKAADEEAEQISKSVERREQTTDLGNTIREPSIELVPENPNETPEDPKAGDTRSPLERFRTPPKKALSVTDLVSPAWCELQYWYTLTVHGRKRRTAEMKQGTRVHQKLEEQVHTTVRVDVQTKEDAWGLRIWNVIQGLRTLRSTGQTRELEIWGTVDGLVVNGIIDELSYICPDVNCEESLQKPQAKIEPPPDQTTISDFFKAQGGAALVEAARAKRRTQSDKVYLCDVKTRSIKKLPSGAAVRPTKMQLMLYHQLLSALATNTMGFSVLTDRYNLDPLQVFSDSFIVQVGSLNDDVFYDAPSEPSASQDSEPSLSQDSMSQLLAHNTLTSLWSFMIEEFQKTLPNGVDSLGKVLKAEYRSRDTGEILGSNTFAMNEEELKKFLDHEMEWWKGERKAEGVVVEEAYKCRGCDYAENCEWRLGKIEEAMQNVRKSKKTTAK
ncbi:hypothetical protein G7Y89_g14624 [Cudoniella acicularis]|uniref:Exonuclease V n=1 Tax=Cudoniella acicularis TaxID=354080 RepID=A0A8H4QZ06_9HELO|nr:hypothetical protein G7Y89_g14624 [Cudoniella acicularis]